MNNSEADDSAAIASNDDCRAAMPESPVRPGRYRHYKGNAYVVLGVARHSETGELLVVYRQDYGDRGLWVRPQPMFSESVTIDGRDVPRFEYVGPVE